MHVFVQICVDLTVSVHHWTDQWRHVCVATDARATRQRSHAFTPRPSNTNRRGVPVHFQPGNGSRSCHRKHRGAPLRSWFSVRDHSVGLILVPSATALNRVVKSGLHVNNDTTDDLAHDFYANTEVYFGRLTLKNADDPSYRAISRASLINVLGRHRFVCVSHNNIRLRN